MRYQDLPSPGAVNAGLRLRKDMAATISYLESRQRRTETLPVQVTTVKAFLVAALAKVTEIEESFE